MNHGDAENTEKDSILIALFSLLFCLLSVFVFLSVFSVSLWLILSFV
jgi:hypothetical protein